MKEKHPDPRARWVYHVVVKLLFDDGSEATTDNCVHLEAPLVHEQAFAALRARLSHAYTAKPRTPPGEVPLVGATSITPKVVFLQTPKLIRQYRVESGPQQATGPVLVQ